MTLSLFWRLLLYLLCLFPVFIINMEIGNNGYSLFQWTNLIIVLFALYKIYPLFSQIGRTDTNSILYLFIYLFIGIAPLYQYSKHVTLWGGEQLTGEHFFLTNCIFIIALISYEFFYKLFYNKEHAKPKQNLHIRYHTNKKLPILITILSTLITLYAFKSYPLLLFLREIRGEEIIKFDSFGNTSLNLIYTILIRPIPITVLVFYNYFYSKFDKSCIFLLIISLITNFPLSLPRFYVAALYLPLLLSFFKKLIYHHILIKNCFILGTLYLFPFLNQGRTVKQIDDISFSTSINYEMFLEGHFDTFQNFTRVIINDTVTWGQQLIGVILFWVPRSIFPNKPIGSGGYIAHLYGLNFDHISLNYWGEGWINFGIVGIPIFSIILAYINAKLDYKFWENRGMLLFAVIYFIYLGLMFFILRGDLISCFAYTVGMFLSAYLCYKTFTIKS